MSLPSLALVAVLRETADRLQAGDAYQWAHFGRCNCGHLVQTVTRLSPAEIHSACSPELLEWSEIPDDYCAGTGLRLEFLLDRLRELGLAREDLRAIEDLSDRRVLQALPGGHRWLQRNRREDVVEYFRVWASLVERDVEGLPSAETPVPVESADVGIEAGVTAR